MVAHLDTAMKIKEDKVSVDALTLAMDRFYDAMVVAAKGAKKCGCQ